MMQPTHASGANISYRDYTNTASGSLSESSADPASIASIHRGSVLLEAPFVVEMDIWMTDQIVVVEDAPNKQDT